jgi:hypothetical protein
MKKEAKKDIINKKILKMVTNNISIKIHTNNTTKNQNRIDMKKVEYL